ncbi:mechanosensitive channel MscK precursor [Janthinobacterium sp. HH103]|uniref:mechanosensitive ion channel family protein n=1 Tax=unclassified Janthinobacterium TaxID=2610881 RepID=UPI0008757895|nr:MULTISPECIES: mechanosensitive ion channel domain-containing protein [unclassified Janthinobacterium]OEZ67854.1 mechanosensitive channel MscK precursor [Janthinobacterium sp. HH103]OEZ70339.1 mechanosensitive channel MscK precursor [Janthinobacterium sp. HH100]QOU75295.1 Mechanosensitive ion channel [Janthinobacterium sp. HH102]
MNETPLLNLITDFVDDFRQPAILWQALVILACLALSWLLVRQLRVFLHKRAEAAATPATPETLQRTDSFIRILTPVLAAMLLGIAQHFLAKFQSVNLLSIAIPLCTSMALVRFGFYVLRRIFARHGDISPTMLLLEKIFTVVVWAGMALYITGLWPELHTFLESIVVPLGRNKVSVAAILQAAISVAVLLVLAMWAGTSLDERLMKMQGLHTSLRVVLSRMGRAVLILVSVLVSLSLVGIDLTVLSVFGGAFGVALGFGLQKIAANFVSGFIILLDRSLTIGDMITVGQFTGKVTQINTRYTVLLGGDGVESIVPNEMLISGGVQNMSLSNRMVWLSTAVSVGYETDLDVIFPLLEAATAKVPRVSQSNPPSATLVRFGADGLDVQIGFWIADPENGTGGVKSNVNRAIWRTLQEHKVTVPFPQRELRIVGTPAAPLASAADGESPPSGTQP